VLNAGEKMTRLVNIAKKVREQERSKNDFSSPTSSLSSSEGFRVAAAPSLSHEASSLPLDSSQDAGFTPIQTPVRIVEKIVYVRKDPKTRLDQNFNVRMPGSFLLLLKRRFGERGATVFCRLAILEKMRGVFDESELKDIGFFQLLEEQYALFEKAKSRRG